MADSKRTIADDWFDEVWNKGRAEAIAELLAEDALVHGLTEGEAKGLRGPTEFRPFYDAFRSAFPDIRVAVVDTVCEGDKIAARCEVRGTHKGEGIGVPASNQSVLFTGMVIIRVENGKIAEAWNNFDFRALYSQVATPLVR